MGDFTGEFIKNFLDDLGIKEDFTKIKGDSRINVKLKCQDETEINAGGPDINDEEIASFLEKISSLTKDDILVMSGSIPQSLNNDFYKRILDIKNIDFTIDIAGKELLDYLEYKPLLVKPNIDELEAIINNWLLNLSGSNRILLGALLGAMMAIDMGGPINKAAYAFAIGVFTDTGIGSYMAAIMVGGMVPPIAIVLACSLFKNKFTEKEKETKITNFILDLSFITEGAIPFAASEPQSVIPSVAIGSAIAGALVGAFNVESPAPHGGVFVLPAMSSLNQVLFFLLEVASRIYSRGLDFRKS